ncbi:MAG: hypothetical protein ACTSQA_00460 [Candidatus Heimdallarchaeaceae archaeon]
MLTDNTIYRVLPTQIPVFWDAIKFACIKADEIEADTMFSYFTELLKALLSDKAQCFIALDKNKILHTIAITRIVCNAVFKTQEFNIQCMYSVSPVKDRMLQKYFDFLVTVAKDLKCDSITFYSKNNRIWEIAKTVGSVERYRYFIYAIEEN